MEKFKITILEGAHNGTTLEASLNPKEIEIDKAIPWERQASKGASDLTYSGGIGRTMGFELIFDGFATGTSIQGDIDKLQRMSDVDSGLKRPPKVKVIWGAGTGDSMPGFDGVIEALALRYVMFDPNGKPLRGTANLKLREARNLSVGKAS